MLYAVVEVNADHLVSQMMYLFLVLAYLVGLPLQLDELFIQLHALGGGGTFDAMPQVRDGGAVTRLLFMHIVGAHTGDGVWGVAVHIDERLESVFLAAVKQPVDGALLVYLQVVGVEVVQEIAADDVLRLTAAAESFRDESQVFVQRFLAIDRLNELHEATGDVVVKVFVVADGDNVVYINRDGLKALLIDPMIILPVGF